MTNNAHLLLTPKWTRSPGELMKALGQRYVQSINRTYRRSGTRLGGEIQILFDPEDHYLLQCKRYIELNPVRAAMVDDPAEYRWSSYRANA